MSALDKKTDNANCSKQRVYPVAAQRIPGEGFGTPCEDCFKCNRAYIRTRGASCTCRSQLKQSQNAVADRRAAKSKNNDLDSSENQEYNGTSSQVWEVFH